MSPRYINQPKEEIYSEYVRVKHELMDYDMNLRDSIGNVRVLMKVNGANSRIRSQLLKAQKHVGMILDVGLSSGAIPPDSDPSMISFVEGVSIGRWRSVEDFERCQKFFRDSYIKTRFYSVTMEKPKMLAPHEV